MVQGGSGGGVDSQSSGGLGGDMLRPRVKGVGVVRMVVQGVALVKASVVGWAGLRGHCRC